MLIIGERLNATRKTIAAAIRERNENFITAEASAQLRAGAMMLDVNAGFDPDTEKENLNFLVKTVLNASITPLCLDSSSPETLEAALQTADRFHHLYVPTSDSNAPFIMINSITAEQDKYDSILPLIKDNAHAVIALCIGDDGMPADADERFKVGVRLVDKLLSDGIAAKNIYVDPLVVPVGVNPAGGTDALTALKQIKGRFPDVNTILGLSNISFGLPGRSSINQAYLAMAVLAGVDAVIIDPLDQKLMSTLKSALAIAGKDPFCSDYIAHYRTRNRG
ncbi:MAG: dihydropteroate synthase [bacterium]